MSGRNGARGPSGPWVYRRIRRLAPEELELRHVPPARSRPVEFKGKGLGRYGRWRPGLPLGPAKRNTESLLDWAFVSWARQHVVEEVIDYTTDVDDAELRTDAEVCAIARECGLEPVD